MKPQAIQKAFEALTIEEQEQLIATLVNIYIEQRAERLRVLSKEVAAILTKKAEQARERQVKTRAKPKPTHRSKKNRKLVWTGRGSMPRWMREEMKEPKLKPDAFLIRKK